MTSKRYLVEMETRLISPFIVKAGTAEEAREIVEMGGGEHGQDWYADSGKPRIAPLHGGDDE